MHEQLTMDLPGTTAPEAPTRPAPQRPPAAEAPRPAPRRRHRPAGGPRRGEPDVPDDVGVPFVDFRIDPASR
ncbi:MAG: hypothetical protein ACYDA2_09695, partial [Acidimicrobiales bacterium]